MTQPAKKLEAATRRSALMVGEFRHGAAARALATGFRALDWNVAEVDVYDYFIMSRLAPMRVINRVLEPWAKAVYNADIVPSAAQNRVELAIFTKGSYVTPRTLSALRQRGIPSINYFTDFHFGHDGIEASMFEHYDLAITTKTFQLEFLSARLGEERVAFVHQGYAPGAHRRRAMSGAPRYRWDIAYTGNASAYKLGWLVEVARRFPDKSMIVVGNGWKDIARGTPLEPFILGHALSGDFYARVIGQSRVNLAVHFGQDPLTGWADHVSTRTFEIPACGGFMLHIDNAEVRTLFDVPSEIDVFANEGELCDKIDHYLRHEAEREAMLERAYARAVPAYSMTARASEIGALVEARVKV